jgi:hypothetical protein
MKKLLGAAVLLLVLAPAAWAKPPAVPIGEQQQLKSIMDELNADDLAYVPTQLPAHYEVSTTQTAYNQLTLTFTNTKYADGSAKSTASALNFSAQPFKGKLVTCAKGSDGSLKVAGKTVYVKAGHVVWRCMRAPSGQNVVVLANSPSLGYDVLERVIATAARMKSS